MYSEIYDFGKPGSEAPGWKTSGGGVTINVISDPSDRYDGLLHIRGGACTMTSMSNIRSLSLSEKQTFEYEFTVQNLSPSPVKVVVSIAK